MAFARFIAFIIVVLAFAFLAYVLYDTFFRPNKPAGAKKTPATASNPKADRTLQGSLNRLVELQGSTYRKIKDAIREFYTFANALESYVPPVIFAQVRTILAIIGDFYEDNKNRKILNDEKYLIFSVLTDYVPALIKSYVTLPLHERVEGTESTELVKEQLAKIISSLEKIKETENQEKITELKKQSSFIQERFKEYGS
jgi:hypothetical protein